MVIANIHAAKTNLSKLIERAEAGEDVVIARNGKPVVRLAAIPQTMDEPRGPDGLPTWMGSLKGQITLSPDFDAADAEVQKLFDESKIFPWEENGP